ncbi:DoxX family protein [Gimesia panareensis]|uniref:Uncharacterized protein n=1 Tax=Gimesia panareensis TaxID=2527978 RepID=A0A518A367_9PLAN|nr:DoxX family protein [Gimesia panareensis]QDT26152.1 hypothetical protein Enr10x_14520 [Gimesia panareensis]QDU49081.1 hypothetical protein Pan110_13990 [Gimesia panareensis]
MNEAVTTPVEKTPRVLVWIGRLMALPVAFLFGMSAVMKFKGGPEFSEGMAKLGLPESMIVPLAILELVCLVLYLVPWTAVLGAILLTGYLGGAICTHWRVEDSFVIQVGLGIFLWLGLYLRDRRLWQLIPFRSLTE